MGKSPGLATWICTLSFPITAHRLPHHHRRHPKAQDTGRSRGRPGLWLGWFPYLEPQAVLSP
jgi:hypothetical protein